MITHDTTKVSKSILRLQRKKKRSRPREAHSNKNIAIKQSTHQMTNIANRKEEEEQTTKR